MTGFTTDVGEKTISVALAEGSKAEAKGTNAGEYAMGLTKEDFVVTSSNYSNIKVVVIDGGLTVSPATMAITITGDKKEYTFDGTEKTASGYAATSNSALLDRSKIVVTGTDSVTKTDAGTYAMGLVAGQFSYNDTNFENVTFTVTDGELKINKATLAITITGTKVNTTYDGTEKTASGYTATSKSTLFDDSKVVFTGTDSVKKTDAGTYDMGLADDQFSYNDANFENVTFNVTDGELKINKATLAITITGDKKEYTYDGTEKTASGYKAASESTLFDESKVVFTGTDNVTKTDAGTYTMGLTSGQFSYDDVNFENVPFTVADGELKINKVKDVVVAITGHNNTTGYDATEHSVSGYDVTSIKIGEEATTLYTAADFDFSGGASATRTDAGTTHMGLKSEQFSNRNNNFEGVTFTVVDGYQKINPLDVTVTVTGNNGTFDYDGAAHTVSRYTVTNISNELYNSQWIRYIGETSISETEAGSYPMGLDVNNFSNNNDNFNVTFVVAQDGQLVINPISATVTIAEHSDSVDYDGEEHTVTGYDVKSIKIGNAATTLYTEDDFTFSGTASASGTNAGSYDMELTADDFTNTNDNFTNVEFVIEDGALVVKPIDVMVTITGHHDSATYDGKDHSISGYDVEISNSLYAEADFAFSGTAAATQTDAGIKYMGLAEDQFTNTNNNFKTVTFNVTDGYQEIVPVNEVVVTITGKNSTVDYDGDEHSVSGYDVEISNHLYTQADFTFTRTADMNEELRVARTDAGTTYMGLAKEQFKNTNKNFANVTFNVTDGYQTITPINATVTITENSSEVDFDGEEHTVTGYTAEANSELYDVENDFTFSGTASVSGTDAGSYDMELKAADFTNTNDNFANVTFVIVDGQLTIDPIDVTVTITEHGDKVTYNSEEHTVSGYDVSIGNKLYSEADFSFSGTDSISGTNAGSYDMELKADDFTNTNTNFANVTFTIVDGQLVIDPMNVTVTITGASNTAPYDGTAHSVTGYTATAGSTLYDVDHNISFSGSQIATRTDAGTTNMGLANSQFANTNGNFNVTFSVTDGYQTINPINTTVTITGANNTTAYDGTAHGVSGYTATATSTLYDVDHDFTFGGTATATRTEAGTTNMGLAVSQFANTNPNFGTVTFDVTDGYQTIDPISATVTITENSGECDYDGAEHTVTGYTVKSIQIDGVDTTLYTQNDFQLKSTANASVNGTNAGTYDMDLKPEDFENKNGNFENVTFVIEDGTLVIKPIDVTVTVVGTNNITPYDGKEHTVTGYTATADTTLYDVDHDITFGGADEAKQTNAGTKYMGLEASQFANTNTNFGTVKFNVTDGYQTVEQINATVTITGHHSADTFDGQPHSVSGYDVDIAGDLYKEADFTFTPAEGMAADALIARTNEGTTNMGLLPKLFANTNGNFANVTFNVTDGYQTITPIDEVVVTITGHTNTTDYDGKDHTITGYDVEFSSNLYTVNDFTFSGEATATQQDAGTAYMGLTKEQFTNKSANFAKVTFEVTDGYQAIDPINAAVTITGANDTTAYDGEAHTVTGYKVETNSDLYTAADFTFTPAEEMAEIPTATQTDAGTEYMGLNANQFANKNGNFKKVTFTVNDGYQTVSKINAVVTITERGDKVTYDGQSHTVTGYDVTSIKIGSEDTELYTANDFTFDGTGSISGKDAGSYDMELTEDDFTNTNANFETVTFVIEDGQLVIDPLDVTVTITGENSTVDYDGKEHKVSGYSKTADSELYDLENDFSFNGTDEAASTKAGTVKMGLEKNQFQNTNNNFNVAFDVTDGYQTVNKVAVTVTAEDKERTGHFAEEEEPELTATITGLVNDEPESLIRGHESFSITRAQGTELYTPGEYEITVSGPAELDNYEITYVNGKMTVSDDRYPLYNAATINGNTNMWYRLKKQDNAIITKYPLSDYLKGLANGKVKTVPDGEYIELASYDFTNQVVIFNDIEYYYSADGNPNPNHPDKGFYTVAKRDDYIVAAKNKISGWQDNWLIPENERYEEPEDGQRDSFHRNYNITLYDAIIVVAKNASRTYNASEQKVTNTGYNTYIEKIDGTRIYKGTNFGFHTEGVGSDVGDYAIDISDFEYGKTVGENRYFAAKKETGTLTITKRDLTITAKSNPATDFIYNGLEQTWEKWDKKGIQGRDVVTAVVEVDNEKKSIKDVAETAEAPVANKVVSYTITRDGEDKSGNYNVILVDGELVMHPRGLKVSTSSATKNYDGTALTKNSAKLENLKNNETATIKAIGSRIDAGSSPNNYEITWGTANPDNYYIQTENLGTLTINPVAISIVAENKSKEYDNNTETDPELTAKVTGVPAKGVAPVYSLSREPGQEVGEYAISVTAEAASNPNYTVSVLRDHPGRNADSFSGRRRV